MYHCIGTNVSCQKDVKENCDDSVSFYIETAIADTHRKSVSLGEGEEEEEESSSCASPTARK